MNAPPIAPRRSGSSGAAAVGVVLIVLGLLIFGAQQLGTDVADWGWPLYVILPGVALLTMGLVSRAGPGLAIAGSIVTTVGLVLLFQKIYDYYESWAYAWALVGPGASGMGMLLYGTRARDRKLARDGFWTVVTGLAIFAMGFIFFEGIIGISGNRYPLPNWVMPALIVVVGLLVLGRGLTVRRAPEWEPAPPPAPSAVQPSVAPAVGAEAETTDSKPAPNAASDVTPTPDPDSTA